MVLCVSLNKKFGGGVVGKMKRRKKGKKNGGEENREISRKAEQKFL